MSPSSNQKNGKSPPGPSASRGDDANVWQDLARMEAELQDPDEEATTQYSREDLFKLAAATGASPEILQALGAGASKRDDGVGVASGAAAGAADSPASAEEEPPPITTAFVERDDETLHFDPGDEDETLHHDPGEVEDATLHHDPGAAPPSDTLAVDEEAAVPTQARPARLHIPHTELVVDDDDDDAVDISVEEVSEQGSAAPAATVDDAVPDEQGPPSAADNPLATTVALDELPDFSVVEPDAAPAEAPAAGDFGPQAPPQRSSQSDASASDWVPSPASSNAAARVKPSDYLLAARASSPPPAPRGGGADRWTVVLFVSLVALAAALVFLWTQLT